MHTTVDLRVLCIQATFSYTEHYKICHYAHGFRIFRNKIIKNKSRKLQILIHSSCSSNQRLSCSHSSRPGTEVFISICQGLRFCTCVSTVVCVYQGKSRDKVGLFPANFVQRVRPGERVWKVTDGFHGNRDKGQMSVKESQVSVPKNGTVQSVLCALPSPLPVSPSPIHACTPSNVCKFMQKTAEV